MNTAQQKRFDSLYRKHLSALKRQGKAEATIDAYGRAVRRLFDYFDCPPDILTVVNLVVNLGHPYFECFAYKADNDNGCKSYTTTTRMPHNQSRTFGTQSEFVIDQI